MRRLEQQLQIAATRYIRIQYPQLLFFHVPNGGYRTKAEGGIFKAMGVISGVPDILLFWDKSFAAIELKIGKNPQQDKQKLFEHQWKHRGGQYAVCRSIDEIQACLKAWRVA